MNTIRNTYERKIIGYTFEPQTDNLMHSPKWIKSQKIVS